MAFITDLVVELLIDIFSRLTATDLLGRVRYTCTLWRAIINTDSTLHELHLHRALIAPPGYLYTYKYNPNLYFLNHLLDTRARARARRLPEGVKLANGIGGTRIFGHILRCNGLICYQLCEENDTCFCIRNPFVKGAVQIHVNQVRELTWGFGYAQKSKKYKIVRVMQERKPSKKITAAIYTVGESRWRALDIPSGSRYWQSPVYWNGVLYWSVAVVPATESEYHVVLFDLETEKFQFRLLLPRNPIYLYTQTHLVVLGDAVAFVIDGYYDCQYVWVLIDEESDTWTEKFVLSGPKGHFYLVGAWMNQELYGMYRTCWNQQPRRDILGDEGEWIFVLYNKNGWENTTLQLPFAGEARRIAPVMSLQLVVPHTGTLVSPRNIVEAV